MLVPILFWDDVACKVVPAQTTGAQIMSDNGTAVEHAWAETLAKYLQWGATQGRKDGNGWSPLHLRNSTDQFRNWLKVCKFQSLLDVTPMQYSKFIQQMRDDGKSSKYRRAHETALNSFMNWCVREKILTENPIANCRKSSAKPARQSRVFTFAEFRRLLAAAPERAVLYRFAVLTGFRRAEIQSLRGANLQTKEKLVRLAAENEKMRVERWFPLTPKMTESLKGTDADKPVFTLAPCPVRKLDRDMALADISKDKDGVIDFHGLRRTGITWLGILGAPPGIRHAFSRHSDHTTNQRYDIPGQALLRSWICRMEKALDDPHDTGKYPQGDLNPRPQAENLIGYSDSITVFLELALAYHYGTDEQRTAFRQLSVEALRQKFGAEKGGK